MVRCAVKSDHATSILNRERGGLVFVVWCLCSRGRLAREKPAKVNREPSYNLD